VRQSLDASRMVSADPGVHEQMVREMLGWLADADLRDSPPRMGQRLHQRLREVSGVADAYREAKDLHNALAASLLPDLRARVEAAEDPFDLAVRLAIAGNVIDLGVRGRVSGDEVRGSIEQALSEPVTGPIDELRDAVRSARDILYLADNCGEIVLDRLLIEQLPAGRVTVAVRGAPILNDATMADARAIGLTDIAAVIDNGSDAPGTILDDCSPAFQRRFAESDLVIAKGQGNFESLSDAPRTVFILFKVKCGVVAAHVGEPEGSHVVARAGRRTGPMTLVPGASDEAS
jgi:damage-control phosphatase, subfamily I